LSIHKSTLYLRNKLLGMSRLIFLISSFLFFISCFGQSQKQLINYADESYQLGDYYGAAVYYERAMQLDSLDIHLLFKYATALRKYNNYTLAEYYYAKIADKDKGGKIYKDAHFWLGVMQKNNGKYKEAGKTFKRVQALYDKDKKGYYYLKSKQEVISCNYAQRLKNQINEEIEVSNLGQGVNTTQSEFSGFLHNGILYFSSLRADSINDQLEIKIPGNYKTRIFNAKHTTTWQTIGKIDTTINTLLAHNANGCFNTKGDAFYFTRCDSLGSCKLYVARYDGSNWHVPRPLPAKINEEGSNTTQPNIALIDGKEYLFFSSNRKGGYGDLDLWYSEILDGNTYSGPFNAGKMINTPDPEITPFYHGPTKTLYFSSSWHSGFGGFDIFQSNGKPGDFSEPFNMEQPINTQWNDFYFTIDSAGKNGLVTSNRLGVYYAKGPTCCNDIWEVKFKKEDPPMPSQEIVTLDDLNKYLPVTLYFHNDRPGPRSWDTTINDNYLTTYAQYKEMQPIYRTEYSKGLEGEQRQEAIIDIDDYFKHYVDKGVDDLALFTKLLLAELQKGQKIEITIKGFASPLAKTEYNVNLTKRRIATLVNYLREYGNGEFAPYLDHTSTDGGALTFVKIPFGEYTAATGISDDYYDQKNSVYNRKAALERKIEIQSVTYTMKDTDYAGLQVDNGTQDFGKVKAGEVLTHDFIIENNGNKPLRIIEVVSVHDAVKVTFPKEPIAPGHKGTVTLTYNTLGDSGKQAKAVTVIADAFPRTKRLILTAEVFEE
jgi:tetratricopeptide (TPR) repeat protein